MSWGHWQISCSDPVLTPHGMRGSRSPKRHLLRAGRRSAWPRRWETAERTEALLRAACGRPPRALVPPPSFTHLCFRASLHLMQHLPAPQRCNFMVAYPGFASAHPCFYAILCQHLQVHVLTGLH